MNIKLRNGLCSALNLVCILGVQLSAIGFIGVTSALLAKACGVQDVINTVFPFALIVSFILLLATFCWSDKTGQLLEKFIEKISIGDRFRKD